MDQRTFGVSAGRVWEILPGVFEQLDIPVTVRARSTFQMGNAGYSARRVGGKRISTYVDCGVSLNGVLADSYDVTLQVLVGLGPKGEDTLATTTVDARGRQRATSGADVHCASKGTLEKRIQELVAEALLGTSP